MEQDLNNKIDVLLKTKSYTELSEQEQLWVNENLGGETAYQNLASAIQRASQEQKMSVKSSTKKALMQQMKASKEPFWSKIIHYKVPAYASALMLVLAVGLTFFLTSQKEVIVEKRIALSAKTIVDTVKIAQPNDTIFVEKIKEVPVYITEQKTISNPTQTPAKNNLSEKSLADQKELKNLLVRSE